MFTVIDRLTGVEADLKQIVYDESWTNSLVPDKNGWLLSDDGCLYLDDACGNHVPVPPDRFEVRMQPPKEWVDLLKFIISPDCESNSDYRYITATAKQLLEKLEVK